MTDSPEKPTRKKAYHGKGQSRSYETKAGTRWSYIIRAYKDPTKPELGKRTAEFGGFLSEKEADAAKAKALKDVERGLRVGGKVPTLTDFATQWLAAREADPDLDTSTVNGDRRRLTIHVLPRIGHHTLDKITTTMLNELYGKLRTELPLNLPATGRWSANNRKPLGANSTLKIAVTLGDLMDAAISDRYILVNPAKSPDIKKPSRKAVTKEKEQMTVWSKEQIRTFLQWLREDFHDSDYALWSMYAATAARRSEILALRWGDIDLKNRRVFIRRTLDVESPGQTKPPKNGKPRDFRISASAIATLREWRKTLASRDITLVRSGAWVFPMSGEWERHRNATSTSEMFTYRVAKAQEALGEENLPTIHLHEVRHSVATNWIEDGLDVKTASARLGHESVKITLDIYVHVTTRSDDRAAEIADYG